MDFLSSLVAPLASGLFGLFKSEPEPPKPKKPKPEFQPLGAGSKLQDPGSMGGGVRDPRLDAIRRTFGGG